MKKDIRTWAEYIADEEHVSLAERSRIEFEVSLIGKLIEAREAKGFSQRDLAERSGVKQPVIARIETLRSTPQIDTLIKVLSPLGYTLAVVPISVTTEMLEQEEIDQSVSV